MRVATGMVLAYFLFFPFDLWVISRNLSVALRMEEAFLTQYASHARTFPSRMPVLCLDRIYYRGFRLKTATRLKGKPWLFLSDHLPLLAHFQLKHA